ncbi:hypothetical protein TRFO_23233 [Tritrichomonas foetus]|uniref:Uncharacterized protein n=1 Tax=Tritrichomonas foetus TaxID=1144522 RepID=A0A1J4KAJ9_9EUKA|nr:hypothetical protein TRFO_23233 [Tritrichomonas foetus]|eukprot:OHT08243.1 hypothetical protein TRFO_23233 [Tritrichomonas foetus]
MTETGKSVIEKVVLFVVDNAFGETPISKGQYQALDQLALRGQSGFVSTFTDSKDTVAQLIGAHYYSPENLSQELGPMKLAVFTDKSTYNGFGDVRSITGKSSKEIFDLIQVDFDSHGVIVVELNNLNILNEIVNLLLPLIDSTNHAICTICGYGPGSVIPKFQAPPVVDPSWKIIGPDAVETLSVDHPMLFISASQQLTRVDKVSFFSEREIEEHNGMGVLPICQLFREFSYYTGSTWKYGA